MICKDPAWNRSAAAGRSNAYYSASGYDAERWAKTAEWPDYEAFHRTFNWSVLWSHSGRQPIRLLDAGCGLGYFPRMLHDHAFLPADADVEVDLIDISKFSLAKCEANLPPQFTVNERFHATIDALPLKRRDAYDVIWAIHSLYLVRDRQKAVRRLLRALTETGIGIVYLPSIDADYIKLHKCYLRDIGKTGRQYEYNSAEEIVAALRATGARDLASADCNFLHRIPAHDMNALATYVNQNCLNEKRRSAEEWLATEGIGMFLKARLEGDAWVFRQSVRIICFSRSQLPSNLFTISYWG